MLRVYRLPPTAQPEGKHAAELGRAGFWRRILVSASLRQQSFTPIMKSRRFRLGGARRKLALPPKKKFEPATLSSSNDYGVNAR